MKCYAMQKPKHKLSAEAKKKLRKDISEFVALSTVVGAEKALKILKENKGNEKVCETCQYYDTDRQDQPCCSCVDSCNWEESEVDPNEL